MWRRNLHAGKRRTDEIGRVRVVADFLPAPDELVAREDNVKVTLSLSRRSVDFFKRAAKKRRVPYQRMIRALVDAYRRGRRGSSRRCGVG
jgi:predicted DNA binding CopG/RHH family protein